MPHIKTSVSRVRPGHEKAKNPKAIAAIPRSSSSHQFSASSRSARPRNGDRRPPSMCVLDIGFLPNLNSAFLHFCRAAEDRIDLEMLYRSRSHYLYLARSNGGLALNASLAVPARTG